MLRTLKKFFAFCGTDNRKLFVTSIWLGVVSAISVSYTHLDVYKRQYSHLRRFTLSLYCFHSTTIPRAWK